MHPSVPDGHVTVVPPLDSLNESADALLVTTRMIAIANEKMKDFFIIFLRGIQLNAVVLE
jgi:hypothetical protein